jgi:hypothetical protein
LLVRAIPGPGPAIEAETKLLISWLVGVLLFSRKTQVGADANCPWVSMAEKLGYCVVALLAVLGATLILYVLLAAPGARGTGIPLGSILLFAAWPGCRAIRQGSAICVMVALLCFVGG